MSGIIFLDTETTGLDPSRHEVWDIALIGEDGQEWEAHIRPAKGASADPTALRMTRFYERTADVNWQWLKADFVAEEIALRTAGKHLVAAVPSFDAAFLAALLRSQGQCEAWHYHLIDVETLIAGKLGLRPPLDSEKLSRAIGVEPDLFDRHTALGDARWARAMYEAVYQP